MQWYVYENKKKGFFWIKYLREDGKWSSKQKNPFTKEHFKTRKEAEVFAEEYLCGDYDLTMTFDTLFNHYVDDYLRLRPSSSAKKLKSWYKTNIKPIIGNKVAGEIKIKDLEEISKIMLDKEKSPVYINKMTSNIKTIMNFGVDHGYLKENPVSRYKELKIVKNSEDIKFWTPEEFKKVLDSIDVRYKRADKIFIRYFLCFGYFTGLRKGEIRALKWNNIDLEKNLIHVDWHINDDGVRAKGRKNGNGYVVYMDDRTKNLVQKMKEYFFSFEDCNRYSYVFPSIMKGFDHFLGEHTPPRWIEQLAEYNHLENITFHGCRHSAVVYWISIGLNVWQIAEKIGDTVDMVYNVYGGYLNENKIKAAEVINEHNDDFNGFY